MSASNNNTAVPASEPKFAPLHHPGQEAVVQQPSTILSANGGNQLPSAHTIPMGSQMGAGQKALLAKRMAPKNASMVSPTDNMMSPCTAKLAGTKKKHFAKGKPFALAGSFSAVGAPSGSKNGANDDDSDDDDENTAPPPVIKRTAATRMMEF